MAHYPSASSSKSLDIHPASRVPSYLHDPALLEMLNVEPISTPFVDYVVDCVVATVQYALERTAGNSGPFHLKQAPFISFVNHILHVTKSPTATILVALEYLDRARNQMQIVQGQWACERAFLGAMILANKYTNDQNYNHKSWAQASRIFYPRDITRLEWEMLAVLQYDLSVRSEDITSHYTAMITRCRSLPANNPPIATLCHIPSPPLESYGQYPSSSWSPSSSSGSSISSSSSLSPYDSPTVLTPESYLPTPPFDRPEHQRARPAPVPASEPFPYLLADEFQENYSSSIGSQGVKPFAHDLPFPQSLHPSNEKFFGDATDLSSHALNGLSRQPDPHSITLPHLCEVVQMSLTHHSSASLSTASNQYPDYSQLPPIQHTALPRSEFPADSHSFGDLTYV